MCRKKGHLISTIIRDRAVKSLWVAQLKLNIEHFSKLISADPSCFSNGEMKSFNRSYWPISLRRIFQLILVSKCEKLSCGITVNNRAQLE